MEIEYKKEKLNTVRKQTLIKGKTMKLNLQTKLIGSFVIILLMTAVVGLVCLHTTGKIQSQLENTVENDVKPANIMGDVARRVGFVRANSLLHLLNSSIDEMDRYESESADLIARVNTDLNTLEYTFEDQATLAKLAEFRGAWNAYLRIWSEQVVPLSQANRDEEAFALARKKGAGGMAAREAMFRLDELHDVNVSAANNRLELTDQDIRKSRFILSIVILMTILLGLAFSIKQSSLIAGAVKIVSKAAKLVAAGDLDQKVSIKTGDEIESMADFFNTMVGNMKKMVEKMQQEITEHQRAEEELKKHREHLEELVEEELHKRLKELEIFNRISVGRELRMVELKKEINELLVKYGKESKYKIAE
ncbi:MAG: MCP four helix bundle domain-containing protein [Paludibacter sp.]|nr:MCP four helix bundle domain-containing protein [Paludibacter sp.]